LKVISRFFIIIFSTISLVYDGLASEGVYIADKESVVFYSDNYSLCNSHNEPIHNNTLVLEKEIIKENGRKKRSYPLHEKTKISDKLNKVNIPAICTNPQVSHIEKVETLIVEKNDGIDVLYNKTPSPMGKSSPLDLFVLPDVVIDIIKMYKTTFFSSLIFVFNITTFKMWVGILLFGFYFLSDRFMLCLIEYNKYNTKRGPPYSFIF
jgi:hypothetical protein